MEQNVASLNLPKFKINKLQAIGKNYCSALTESVLASLSIDLQKPPVTKTALNLLEEELLNGCILSLNTELDKVLRDEITLQRITELAGFPGSGKTQICFQLSITAQLPKSLGGLEGQVVYMNTNKNFSSHRLRELIKQLLRQVKQISPHLSEEGILKNIFVINISGMVELFAAVKYMQVFLKDKSVKLLIIDSISNPLRNVESRERCTISHKLLEDIQYLATIFNFAIVITNDFTTRAKENKAYHTPSFGDSFFDRVNSRICLSKSQTNSNVYVADLVKSVVKDTLTSKFCMF